MFPRLNTICCCELPAGFLEWGAPESSWNQCFFVSQISRDTILMGFTPWISPQPPTTYDYFIFADTRHFREFWNILGYFNPQFATPKTKRCAACACCRFFRPLSFEADSGRGSCSCLRWCPNTRGNERRNTWMILGVRECIGIGYTMGDTSAANQLLLLRVLQRPMLRRNNPQDQMFCR